MPVYILREGQANIFKIGRTNGDIEGVIRRLRTGNSQALTLFAQVETDQERPVKLFFIGCWHFVGSFEVAVGNFLKSSQMR